MKTLLNCIISIPDIYARFLNTLSLLEYIGARKIIKSQNYEILTEKTLNHSIEELRHARLLKRAAVKILPECETYHEQVLLCGKQAFHYFQTIDHTANTVLSDYNPWHCYLYTTALIEIRAIDFYTQCEEILLALNKPSPFRGILIEEEKHLQDINEGLIKIPNFEKDLAILKKIEKKEFDIFLKALKQSILHS